MTDLLFLIGLFLTLIGGVVFATYLLGPSDLVQNIHVNRLGGGVLLLIGAGMIIGSLLRRPEKGAMVDKNKA